MRYGTLKSNKYFLCDNMAKLRLTAGNVSNPNVHQIGIIALGSHLENHGPALPIQTKTKKPTNKANKTTKHKTKTTKTQEDKNID